MPPLIETKPPSVLRLLIVDDHEVVRRGLVALLERRPAFTVVAQVGTVAEAIEAARTYRPDLVIMDIRLPDGSGIEATREIRAENPAIRVIMLTSYPDEEAVFAAIVAGASGYLLKQIRGRDLIAALEAVGRGESLLGVEAVLGIRAIHEDGPLPAGLPGDVLADPLAQALGRLADVDPGMTVGFVDRRPEEHIDAGAIP